MNLFARKIIGIDLHDYSAEIVEISMKNEVRAIESYNRILVPPDVIVNGDIEKPDKMKKIIEELLKNAKPDSITSKNASIIFPSSKVLTHIFSFPASLNTEEIKKALPYEAETLIPFSINDVYWDFTILEKENPQEKHASQYVFFACITKEVADKYATILEDAGLNPVLFGINVEALQSATLKQIENINSTLIIDIGTLSVNYLILKNGKIKYFFSSNNAGYRLTNEMSQHLQTDVNAIFERKEQKQLTSKEELHEVAQFIEKSFKRGEDIIKDQESIPQFGRIDKVLLTGEFLNLPEFHNLAQKHLSGKIIEVVDPTKNLSITPKKIKKISNLEAQAPALYFTYAIGIAIRGLNKNTNAGINLLPDRLKESFANRKITTIISLASIVIALLTVIIATYSVILLQNINYERIKLEIQKSAVEKLTYGTRYREIQEEINEFNSEVVTLAKIDSALFSLPHLLQSIYQLMPEEVAITNFSFNDTDLAVVINGIAPTREKLLETQKNLENAIFIKEVIAPISNYDEKSQISFLIKIVIDFTQLKQYGYTGI